MSKLFKKAVGLFVLILAFMTMFPLIPTETADAANTNPTLTASKIKVLEGKNFNINIKNKLKGATYQWVSRDKKIAEVNEKNGVVTGVYKGSTTIDCYIKTSANKSIKLSAKVIVYKPSVDIEINNKIKSIQLGETYDFNITRTPKTANDTIVWKSSDKSISNPNSNGVIKANKAGTVTLTATSLSGRKDSLTIKVLAADEKVESDKTDEVISDHPVQTNPGVIISEDFSKSEGAFIGRGNAKIQHVNEAGEDNKKGYLLVKDRTAAWHGTSLEVTNLVVPSKSYTVSGWVKYTEGNATEVFKITQQKNGNSWPAISGEVTVEKNKWTKITGTMFVEADTATCEVYFETASNPTLSFMVDSFEITDPTVK